MRTHGRAHQRYPPIQAPSSALSLPLPRKCRPSHSGGRRMRVRGRVRANASMTSHPAGSSAASATSSWSLGGRGARQAENISTGRQRCDCCAVVMAARRGVGVGRAGDPKWTHGWMGGLWWGLRRRAIGRVAVVVRQITRPPCASTARRPARAIALQPGTCNAAASINALWNSCTTPVCCVAREPCLPACLPSRCQLGTEGRAHTGVPTPRLDP